MNNHACIEANIQLQSICARLHSHPGVYKIPAVSIISSRAKAIWQQSVHEGWLSPTERASSFCNQPPKAHFGLPWVRPWDNRGKCHMDEKKIQFNACQTHRSMYPSIFNRFQVIQPISPKVRHFSTFLHILASLGTPLGQSRYYYYCFCFTTWRSKDVYKCYMDRKRIKCLSNASQHIPIYLQLFTSYSEILVGNCNFFLHHLHLTSSLGCFHWNSGKKVWFSEN